MSLTIWSAKFFRLILFLYFGLVSLLIKIGFIVAIRAGWKPGMFLKGLEAVRPLMKVALQS